MKLKPTITKKEFLEICKLLEAQSKKDHSFAVFMEKYLDGRFVPMMNDYIGLAVEKLMNAAFHDKINDEFGYTWWTWFIYENDFGEKKMTVTLDKVEYVITSPSEFYDFMVLWLKHD